MVLNLGKCHYLMIINGDIANESIELGKKALHGEAEQKILGTVIDKCLNLQSYAKPLIKTVNHKLSALIRVAPFMTDFNKKVIFINSLLKASSIIITYSLPNIRPSRELFLNITRNISMRDHVSKLELIKPDISNQKTNLKPLSANLKKWFECV